jgi:hypothetical protein
MCEARRVSSSSDPNPPVDKPELIIVGGSNDDSEEPRESIEQPAKVMRIGTMIKQLLEEVREAPLDEKSRIRLREIYATSVDELADGLSPDLQEELKRLASPFDGESIPSDSELRIAQAQLVGWLEGIFHGIQATLFAQQAAARAQLEQMGRRGLPSGAARPETTDANSEGDARPGTYL